MNKDEWIDEYGVIYSADKKRLIRVNDNLTEYQIIEDCEFIENYRFESPFKGCGKLNEIICNNPYFQSINGVLFGKDLKTLVAYPPAKMDIEYYIPDSVTTIGKMAFVSCWNLKRIYMSDGIKILDEWDFQYNLCSYDDKISKLEWRIRWGLDEE
jgi:hypothetical protein